MSVADFTEITKTEPERSLLEPRQRSGGRNAHGRMTVRHRGGGHKRRYRMRIVLDLVRRVGLQPAQAFYFNYLLFAPIWLARRVIRRARIDLRSEGEVNTPALNFMLKRIFAADVWSAPWLRPPFGVSILVFAEKPASSANPARHRLAPE
jgi:hypothetical protein